VEVYSEKLPCVWKLPAGAFISGKSTFLDFGDTPFSRKVSVLLNLCRFSLNVYEICTKCVRNLYGMYEMCTKCVRKVAKSRKGTDQNDD
jgi:antirestriction protein